MDYNKVLAGHSRKMRDSKDLKKKLSADMAAIFGVGADTYSSASPLPSLSRVKPKRRTTPNNGGDYGGAVAKRKKRRRNKNRDDDDGSSGGVARKKKKKKRKRAYD